LTQHEPLSAVFRKLQVRQSNERAADTAARSAVRAAAAVEHTRAEQAIHTAARARQAKRSARQTNDPSHFPVHPRHCADWLRTTGMFLGLLTSFVHSQPLWQDHLHESS